MTPKLSRQFGGANPHSLTEGHNEKNGLERWVGDPQADDPLKTTRPCMSKKNISSMKESITFFFKTTHASFFGLLTNRQLDVGASMKHVW